MGLAREIIDFCVPINPNFPPPELLDRIHQNLAEIVKYYPDYSGCHQENLSKISGVPAENIVVTNGSTELINILCRDAKGPIVTPIPTFGRWTDLPFDFGIPIHFVQRSPELEFRLQPEQVVRKVREVQGQTLVLCNPNNPTGAWFSTREMEEIFQSLQDLSLIIVDESFMDFSDVDSAEKRALRTPNLIVVKSLGKAVGWHGIRLGYGVASTQVAHELRKQIPYWNINGLASFVLKILPEYQEQLKDSYRKTAIDRSYMYNELQRIDVLTTFPSKANFLYSELPKGVSGKQVGERLLEEHGIFVRECSNKVGSTESYLRMAVLKPDTTDKLVQALRQVLD